MRIRKKDKVKRLLRFKTRFRPWTLIRALFQPELETAVPLAVH